MSRWIQKPPLGTPINWGHPLAQGLVGCWLMNEGGGLYAFDSSGRNNKGALTNLPLWYPGKSGTALSFDGSYDHVDTTIINGVAGLVANGPYTVCVWALTRTGGVRATILGDWNSAGAENSLAIEFGGYNIPVGNISINHRAGDDNSSLDTGVVYSTDTWYFICLAWNGINPVNAYVNGVFKATYNKAFLSSGTDLTFGRAGAYNGQYLNGLIGEVRIYKRALRAEEIQQLYTDPYAMFEQPRRGKWFYIPVGGLSIPIAMDHYGRLRA